MKHLFLFLMTMLPVVANAEAVEVNGIYYNLVLKAKEAEVTQNPNKYTGSVVIPSFINYDGIEYNVTAIGEKAFYFCNHLTSIIIPNSVNRIDESAFSGCSSLTSISIPNSVTSIGSFAFSSCRGLTTLTIPNSVTSIDDWAFIHCEGLISIIISNNLTEIKSCVFQYCTGLTTVSIPNSVTKIRSGAFDGCNSLTSVNIPNSVTYIGDCAFRGCMDLTSLNIGSGVCSIYEEAFGGCLNLKDVYCYANIVTYTSTLAFKDSYVEYATLHVPDASLANYSNTAPWNQFGTIVGISGGSQTNKCAKPSITYQNGQLKMNCATDGVQFVTDITDTDVKKHYDQTISLTATYNVSVYATKSGYENSDVSTVTLCWIDQAPAISTGSVNVPALPILIKGEDGWLTVEGADDGTQVSVYTMDGMQAGSAVSRQGFAVVGTNLNAGNAAIVKVGNKSIKVIMK